MVMMKFRISKSLSSYNLTDDQKREIGFITMSAKEKELFFNKDGFVSNDKGIITMCTNNFPIEFAVVVSDSAYGKIATMCLENEL